MAHLAGTSVATILARDCRADERSDGNATLRGHVRDGSTSGPAIDAQITLAWRGLQSRAGPPIVTERTLSTRTDSAGRYGFCGLPDGVKITARVVADDRRSAPVDMVLPDREVSVLDLVVEDDRGGGGESNTAAPAVVVVISPVNKAMREFERRAGSNGSYLTRAQIDRMHASD
jgi:hypothetical protein